MLLGSVLASGTFVATSFTGTAAADQVGTLQAQAKTISQELVQEQLQAGAYQQQYSVASARVAQDERAIASLHRQIKGDRQQITKRLHQVRHLAIESYILNGSVSSGAGASLFAENVKTVQSANEYAEISLGDLNLAVEQLHTAQHSEQSQQQTLVRQSAQDQAEQTQQATYLAQANASISHMQDVQAQVTGQLAVAVAQANAAQGQAAAAAVATAQRTTVQRKGSPPASTSTPAPASSGAPSTNTTDPALNPFLQCVVQAESGGNYGAVSPNGLYLGAFQFSQSTWNFAAEAAGRPDLVGVPPNLASKPDQDSLAVALYALDGERPWLGDRCSA
jgi:peptidoglycan hydrolase CwlO-like protein